MFIILRNVLYMYRSSHVYGAVDTVIIKAVLSSQGSSIALEVGLKLSSTPNVGISGVLQDALEWKVDSFITVWL